MLGDALLVAPVFNDRGDVSYYLPPGRWVNYFTNEVVPGGRWVHEQHGFFSLPLLIRPNSLVVVGTSDREVDYDYSLNAALHLGDLEDGETAVAEVYNSKAELELTVTVSRNGSRLTVSAEGLGKPWQLVLRTTAAGRIERVENGKLAESELGAVIEPSRAVGQLSIYLKQ